MATGIIYLMTTAVSGVIKIGKTGVENYNERMRFLESNGYGNVSGLKREFALKIEQYDEIEKRIHEIFQKSRIGTTELFAVDKDIVKWLLTCFNGTVIYPEVENTEDLHQEANDKCNTHLIPDGDYTFERYKQSEQKNVKATAKICNGCWTILKESILGLTEDAGVGMKVREKRISMGGAMSEGKLLEDVELGDCTPSFAGQMVFYAACDGWTYWKNGEGETIDIYRRSNSDDE